MKRQLCCVFAAAALLSISLLAGCSQAQKPTEEEVAALKKQYPYSEMNPLIDYGIMPMDAFSRPDYVRKVPSACVVATVTGQWKSPRTGREFELRALENFSCQSQIILLPVQIDSVLWSNRGFSPDKGEHALQINTRPIYTGYDRLKQGDRVVMLVTPLNEDNKFRDTLPDSYEAALTQTYLLTEDERMVALYEPGQTDYTGYPVSLYARETAR